MRLYRLPFYGITYRTIMRLAHRFNWHYAPPCYPDGDTVLWCHWCGMQWVKRQRDYKPSIGLEPVEQAIMRKSLLRSAKQVLGVGKE